DDLAAIGGGIYQLIPLLPRSGQLRIGGHPPATDFIVRAEEHGIPQAHHRVIIVGVRMDRVGSIGRRVLREGLLPSSDAARIKDVLKGMPILRSGLTDVEDGAEEWRAEMLRISKFMTRLSLEMDDETLKAFRMLAEDVAGKVRAARTFKRYGGAYSAPGR